MAVKCTRSLGQITNIAIYGAPVNFDIHALYMGEKTLNGIIGKWRTQSMPSQQADAVYTIGYTAQDFKDVIQAVSDGRIECEDLCTARIPLDNLVEGGFKELINNKETHVKILVKH